ncbi:hypothetical protein EDB80DRAFT_864493 [Ilyonectria destructans]|nr:hypothetical protein EDB80DRAFT_864493 [Ilyonectria destructans]
MSGKADNQREAEFSSYYLQRTTQELSEDLDKGAGLFSAEDQKRVVTASKSDKGENA